MTKVLDGIASDLERFYRGVVESLVAYVPKAPRLPREPQPTSGGKLATGDASEEQVTPVTAPGTGEMLMPAQAAEAVGEE